MTAKIVRLLVLSVSFCFLTNSVFAESALSRKEKREQRKAKEQEALQSEFQWWPTDATPGMVKDPERGGYWWSPTVPGKIRPWGNRGYLYVYKIIYDYKGEDEAVVPAKVETVTKAPTPAAAPAVPELRPSLLIRKIIRNVKIYFDYNKAQLREDHFSILEQAVKSLSRNPEASILITGNCDKRGSDEYNMKLGNKRGEAVKQYMLEKGIPEGRIFIVSQGKLNAVSPVSDLVGMQKDRNAQFMIAEVEEIMIPAMEQERIGDAKEVEEGKYIIEKEEKVETAVKVSTREYIIQKGDSLSRIAQREMGGGHRWKYLYELNADVIKDPNKLKVGQTIIIPIE
jgi:outer membrane protein OmpA-like peptidoglycan-associated protein